jgi:hypothetical protein
MTSRRGDDVIRGISVRYIFSSQATFWGGTRNRAGRPSPAASKRDTSNSHDNRRGPFPSIVGFSGRGTVVTAVVTAASPLGDPHTVGDEMKRKGWAGTCWAPGGHPASPQVQEVHHRPHENCQIHFKIILSPNWSLYLNFSD